MEQFKLLMHTKQYTYFKLYPDLLEQSKATIIKETRVDEEFFLIEILCENISHVFMFGNFLGYKEGWDECAELLNESHETLTDLLGKTKGLIELNKSLMDKIKEP